MKNTKEKQTNQKILFAILFTLIIGITAMVYATLSVKKTDSEAARPGAATAATITINQQTPKLGDTVNFTVNGASRSSRITVACYQGGLGNMVYSADQESSSSFVLGGISSPWLTNNGPADCYAWLYNRTLSKGFLAATIFAAEGR